MFPENHSRSQIYKGQPYPAIPFHRADRARWSTPSCFTRLLLAREGGESKVGRLVGIVPADAGPPRGEPSRGAEVLVIIGGKTWPQDLRWILAISASAVAAAGCYGWEWWAEGLLPGGSSRTGLACGVAGGLIILFELLLWPRKRVRSWRLGSAQTWLRAHIWLGLLAVPLVLMHARLLLIGGWLNLALMATFLIVIASGVWGLCLQQFLPTMLLEQVPAETIYEQIDHVARQRCRDLEKLVGALCVGDPQTPHDHSHEADDDGAEYAVVTGFRALTGIQGKVLETIPVYSPIPGTLPIRRCFFSEVRPYLLDGKGPGREGLASAAAAAKRFAALGAESPPEAALLIEHLAQACDQRRQGDLQMRIHRWLHGWLLVHVPLSVSLAVLLAVHIPVALWYW